MYEDCRQHQTRHASHFPKGPRPASSPPYEQLARSFSSSEHTTLPIIIGNVFLVQLSQGSVAQGKLACRSYYELTFKIRSGFIWCMAFYLSANPVSRRDMACNKRGSGLVFSSQSHGIGSPLAAAAFGPLSMVTTTLRHISRSGAKTVLGCFIYKGHGKEQKSIQGGLNCDFTATQYITIRYRHFQPSSLLLCSTRQNFAPQHLHMYRMQILVAARSSDAETTE